MLCSSRDVFTSPLSDSLPWAAFGITIRFGWRVICTMITPLAYLNLYLTLASTAVVEPGSAVSSAAPSDADDALPSLESVTALLPTWTQAGTLIFDSRLFDGDGLLLFDSGSLAFSSVLQHLPITYPSVRI